MQLSMSETNLIEYLIKQLNFFFPDKIKVLPASFGSSVQLAIQRLDYCFSKINNEKYRQNNETIFNHLFSDQYLMFLWFLSNTVWKETGNELLASKIYYLNKSLHSFDCMYDTELPDIFFIAHGVGTVLGKASYNDFFTAMEGCTVGGVNREYPVIGIGVSLTANSSIIGDCLIGNNTTISTNIYKTNVEDNMLVFRDPLNGKVVKKETDNHLVSKVFDMTCL